MNYMLKFAALVNIKHFRNIFRDVKYTQSETNYDHLIKIITPGGGGVVLVGGGKDTCANIYLPPCIGAEHTARKIAKLFNPITSNTEHKCFITCK